VLIVCGRENFCWAQSWKAQKKNLQSFDTMWESFLFLLFIFCNFCFIFIFVCVLFLWFKLLYKIYVTHFVTILLLLC
jgi:hypothetical protein